MFNNWDLYNGESISPFLFGGRMPFFSWILALTLVRVTELLISKVMILSVGVLMKISIMKTHPRKKSSNQFVPPNKPEQKTSKERGLE